MPRTSRKNQLTVPVATLSEAGMRAGERVVIEPVADGELRGRRLPSVSPALNS